MTDKYFVLSENILGLRTNVDGIQFSWGIAPPASSRQAYEACKLRVRLCVEDLPAPPTSTVMGKYHYFSGVPGTDTVYYQRTFLFQSKLRMKVVDLLSDEPTVYVNPTYYRYIKHRIMNLHSVGYILTDMIALLLLHKGYAPLHCSAIRKDDATVVIFAPPNTGKTLTAMMACLEHGADFIAEDLAITDGQTIYSVPWTNTFRYYSNVDTNWLSKVKNILTKTIPLFELFMRPSADDITAFVPPERIIAESKITHVVILERGELAVLRDEPLAELHRKIVNLNRYEFNYCRAPALTTYEFFNPTLQVCQGMAEEQTILKTIVEQADHRIVLRTTDPLQYVTLLLDALSIEE